MKQPGKKASFMRSCHQRLLAIHGIILFLLFVFLFSSSRAAAQPTQLPQTGQTACYEAAGGVMNCAETGQDGDTLSGVAWPQPRFTDNGDQTVTDKLTGLVWTRHANPAGGYKTWQQALDYIKTLNSKNYLGRNDWRLPNVYELESLVNKQTNIGTWLHQQGFSHLQIDYYWTSSTYLGYRSYAWSVGMYGGVVAGRNKADGSYVWPVRNGRLGTLTLPKTGQTVCYNNSGTRIACAGTGQDGESQAGAAWPDPRFIDNGDMTTTDRLTRLIWSKDAKGPGPALCNPEMNKSWQDALNYIKCLNTSKFLGKSDWRLPNRNELASLVDYGKSNCAARLNAQGFTNVQEYNYWSSSTYSYAPWNAWSINMQDGAVTSIVKKINHYVWPVRSVQ